MNTPLVNALLITVIGMGIVFAAILVLWGLMSLLVRLTTDRKEEPSTSQAEAGQGLPETIAPASSSDREKKRRAAAAAVAVAMASSRQQSPQIRPLAMEPGLSAWQSVMRANQIKSKQQRGRVR